MADKPAGFRAGPAVKVTVSPRQPKEDLSLASVPKPDAPQSVQQPVAPPPPPPALKKPAQSLSDDEQHVVITLSGMELEVLSAREKTWYEGQQMKYLEGREFTASDKVELDQLMAFELQVMRLNTWIAAGKDYKGRAIAMQDISMLQRRMKDTMALAKPIKDSLGLSRSSRRAEAGSVHDYIANLRVRAKQYGVRRNDELLKAILLWKELESIVGAYDRSNEEERFHLGFQDEAAIVQWIRTKFPEYNAIDEKFRQGQRTWVGREL